jgi:hypothetical protein
MTKDRLRDMAYKVGIYGAGQAILTRDGNEGVSKFILQLLTQESKEHCLPVSSDLLEYCGKKNHCNCKIGNCAVAYKQQRNGVFLCCPCQDVISRTTGAMS